MSTDLKIIEKYFPNLTDDQKEQFHQLKPLYEDWNSQINVISRKDINQLYERHVLHSLSIAKFITFEPGTKLMDLGCGGGFPGIPLAILFPEVSFTMIDSIGKDKSCSGNRLCDRFEEYSGSSHACRKG